MADSNDRKKYEPLGSYLASLPARTSDATLTFAEVSNIIGDTLPPSAFRYREWWSNQEGGSRAPHWRSAGFKVSELNIDRQTVRFERVTPARSQPRALTLQEVVSILNEDAQGRPIGTLPDWRKQRNSLSRIPKTLFYSQVEEGRDYVFHVGGLSELQFNVGFEMVEEKQVFRHGVAFSLQTTREMPTIEPLIPKVARFNEYLRIYPDSLSGFRMWHWYRGRSEDYTVAPIPGGQVAAGYFIFIGKMQPAEAIDTDQILDDFDYLLPLYQFVEGTEAFPLRIPEQERGRFTWPPPDGSNSAATGTSYNRVEKTVNVDLRHNEVQAALLSHLRDLYGSKKAFKEVRTADGTKIDFVVSDGVAFSYYELKTYSSAQACIREALGQLLEYSLWPGAQIAERLVIVGEAPLDDKAKTYVSRLREAFGLPIEYQQFDMGTGRFVDR